MRSLALLLLLSVAAAAAVEVHSKGTPGFAVTVPTHWKSAVTTSQKGHPVISVSPDGRVDRSLDVIGIFSATGGAGDAVRRVVEGEGRKFHGTSRPVTYGSTKGWLTEWDVVTAEKTHMTEYFCAFALDDATMIQGDGAFLPSVQKSAEADFATLLGSVHLSSAASPSPSPSGGHFLLKHLKGLKQFLFHGTHKVLKKLAS